MPLDDKYIWPTPVLAGKYEPVLNITLLSKQNKIILWKHLKGHHPDKANSISKLMNNPIANELRKKFNGYVVIEEKYVPQCLKAFLE